MADLAAAVAPPGLLKPVAQASAAELAKRGQIADVARQFETQFLDVMLQQMFQGVGEGSGLFGGGPGEGMFKSFLTDAMAKQISKAGGIGVAASVTREMLKMQGLT